jgi:hypothetical protein
LQGKSFEKDWIGKPGPQVTAVLPWKEFSQDTKQRMLKVVYNTMQALTHYKEKGVAYYHEMQEKAAAF